MRKKLLALLAVVAIAAAACGDDDDSTSSSDTTAAPAGESTTTQGDGGGSEPVIEGVRGIEDGKIIVGGVNQESAFGGLGDGAKARFDRFNEEGGIDGLTIEFLGVRDDGGDMDRNTSLVRELVEQDEVYAVIPSTPTYLSPATGDYLVSKNVPYFGFGYAPVMCTTHAFAFNGCTVPGVSTEYGTSNTAALLPILGKDPTDGTGVKVAIAGRAESGGDIFTNVFVETAEQLNMDVVYAKANVPGGGTADMQPFVDAIMAEDPDIVQIVTDFPSALALKAKLVQNGYDGLAVDYAAYVPGLLQSSPQAAAALEGTYVSTTYPSLLEDSAFVKQMTEDLEGVTVTNGAIVGYFQAELFIQMLEKVSPNYDKFVETINAGVDIEPTEGGIPTSWPKFHTQGAPCNSIVKVEEKQYVLATPFDCYETFVPKG
jgi:ABC-type branched-subunit amino acid transport system substrate-binding protein